MQLNNVFRFSRLIASVVLVINVNPSFQKSGPSSLQLIVDTLLDSNNISYQACTSNPNDCSLRGAISKANLDVYRVNQIILTAGTYSLALPGKGEDANATGDLDILTRLSIIGSGKDGTVIDAQGIDRVLQVHAGAWVTIYGVKITGGKTADGGLAANGVDGSPSDVGGGIYNAGHLELDECAVIDNHTGHGGNGTDWPNYGNGAVSGDGGGIYNIASLAIKHTEILSNTSGTGGHGGNNCIETGECGLGANAGDGGGILNNGTLSISNSNLSFNAAGAGGYGGSWAGFLYFGGSYGGVGGSGGGLANSGSVEAISVTIESNIAGAGNGMTGSGGQGGGIYNSGWIAMDQGQINRNQSGDGAGGGGGGGSGGYGGGIYNIGQLSLTDSTVADNLTGNGGGGSIIRSPGHSGDAAILLNSASVSGGDGGFGGGIFNSGNLSLFTTLVEGNVTGNGGNIPTVGDNHGFGGSGGGIYNAGNLQLSFSPVLSNTTGNAYDSEGNGGQGGPGGGIFNANSGNLVSRFSPVTGNQAGRGGATVSEGWGTFPGSGGQGGGVYSEGSLDLRGAMVTRNAAGPGGAGGGGMADALGGDGGGLYIVNSGFLTLTNCIIAENHLQPGGKGSGLYLDGSANLLQLTIARNSGGDGSGINFSGSELTLKNSILASQTVGITATSGTIQLNNTLWGSGAWANLLDWGGAGSFIHSNDIFGDPTFTDPEQGDYHIQPSSPAVDHGVQTSGMIDIDNQPRPNPNTGIVDLGADEVWTLVPLDQVTIIGTQTITATIPTTFNAVSTPTWATPNITYIWYPNPSLGQGSGTAVYNWSEPGSYTITVKARNVGSVAQATQQVIVVPGPIFTQYLPILERSTQ